MGFGFVERALDEGHAREVDVVVVHQEARMKIAAVIEYCGTPMRLPARSFGD